MLQEHLALLARYHLWATTRLLGHVDALGDADYRRDCGLFFKSVHGTLNHLLVGERLVWWRRFSEGVSPQVKLDHEAEPDRGGLRARLLESAAAWAPFVGETRPDRLQGTLDYTTMRGTAASLPWAATLTHVFNHGTHHRGQVTAALTGMGHACPELDLVWMLQEGPR